MKNIIQFFFSPTNTVENIKKYTTNSKIAIIFTCVLFSTLINTAFTIFGILPFGFNVLQFSLTFVTVVILNLIFTGIIFFIGKNLKNKIQGTFLDNLLFLVLSAVIFAFGPIANYIMTTNGLMIWSFLGTFFFLGWSLILMSKSLSKLNQISEGRVTFLVIGSVAVIYAIDYVLPFSLLGRDVAIPNNNIELPYEDINYGIQDIEELNSSISETETPTLSHCDSGECGLEAGINTIKSGLSDIESGTFEDTKSINDPEIQDILSQFKPLDDKNKENNSYENLSGKWVGSYYFNENSINFSLDLKEKEGEGLPGYGTIYEGSAREVMKKEEGGILILKSNIEGFIKDGKIYLQKTYLTENDIFENVGMIGVIEDGTGQIEGTWETVSDSDYGDNKGGFKMSKK